MSCANFAERIADPHKRVALLSMAEAWLRLADHAERRIARETATVCERAAPIDPATKPPDR